MPKRSNLREWTFILLALVVSTERDQTALCTLTKQSPSGGKVFAELVRASLENVAEESISATVTGVDSASAGTGTATVQLYDGAGVAIASYSLVRTWSSTAADYGVDALTGFSVTTGTTNATHTANAVHDVVTDSTGKIVMALDAGGADSVWIYASLQGRIYSSGEIVLTAP